MAKAFISGCAGQALTSDERVFFSDTRPWGLILFARNCASTAQIQDLVGAFRAAVENDDAPVLIDQEGGRVRRLKPPLVDDYPAGAVYGRIFARNAERARRAAWLSGRLMGADLHDLGVTVDCLPIVDVPAAGSSDVIGDRAYGSDVETVCDIALAQTEGLMAAGVLPVLKHIPGHGRALVDSHLELPVVEADAATLDAIDFEPFRRLANLPLAMTAHVVYTALDPDACATQSRPVIRDVIRGKIGFHGCLMSDDVSMKALGDTMIRRVEKLFAAGCDLALHCNGDFAEMRDVAKASPVLSGDAKIRADAACRARTLPDAMDRRELRAEYEALIAMAVA